MDGHKLHYIVSDFQTEGIKQIGQYNGHSIMDTQ